MIAVCMSITIITACGTNITKENKTNDTTAVDSTNSTQVVDTTKSK